MLIRRGKSAESRRIDNANKAAGNVGKERRAEARDLQKNVQGAVSDIVRKHDAISDETGKWSDPTNEVAAQLESLADKAPTNPFRQKPVTADKYITVNGRLVLVKKGRR